MVYVTPLTADDIPHFKEVEKGGGSFPVFPSLKLQNTVMTISFQRELPILLPSSLYFPSFLWEGMKIGLSHLNETHSIQFDITVFNLEREPCLVPGCHFFMLSTSLIRLDCCGWKL